MGGLGGHMAHLSEDLDLTFNEIIDVLGKVARAEVENVTEKVDGQNLFLSVDSMGLIRTARNSSDIKRGGMTPEEYIEKWRGHPAESAFTNGFRALTIALKRLDPQTLQNLFSGGERYINMEIMYPENPNIIHYAAPQVVLHGLKYVGSKEDKEEQKRLEDLADEAFDELVSLVDAAEAEVGEELWTINGPKIVELRRLADGTALAEVEEQIREFARPLGVDATLKDLVKLYLRQFAREEGLPDDITDSMMMLLFDPEKAAKKGIKASSLKKGLSPDLKAVVSKLGTKTNSKKVIASILQPLEVAISDFAIEVLRGLQSFFVSEHDKEILRMQQELQQSIEHLQALSDQGDVKMGELIDKQLAKLKKVENVASTLEGVVFEYPPGSGKVYKLTGAFAMANQIIGRARRSGMNEGMSKQITIKISKTRDVTKTAQEWLNEMRTNNHTPKRIPNHVYADIMNGVPLVDIVRKEDAQEAIYNTVYTYINHEIKETVELEFVNELEQVDSSAADVAPEAAVNDTIAIVPGSFKPPHMGHLKMVEEYANNNNKVIVLISNPVKNVRTMPDGSSISADKSLQMWKAFASHLDNVEIMVSPGAASPMTAAFEMLTAPEPLNAGDVITLGASKKEDDWRRWVGAPHVKGVRKDLEFRDPHDTAAETAIHSPEYMGLLETSPLKEEMPSVMNSKRNSREFHADDMRYLLGKITEDAEAAELLKDFTGSPEMSMEFLSILGIDSGMNEPLEEMSGAGGGGGVSMSSGAVGGYAGSYPLGSTLVRGKPTQKKKRKKRKTENVDLSLIDEVYELLIERGILS